MFPPFSLFKSLVLDPFSSKASFSSLFLFSKFLSFCSIYDDIDFGSDKNFKKNLKLIMNEWLFIINFLDKKSCNEEDIFVFEERVRIFLYLVIFNLF